MLRNAFAVLLLLAASAFDSSPGGSQPDPNTQNFDPNANPEQQPAASGFPTSTSTGKGEKSYQEAIAGQTEGQQPHPQQDIASTELQQTPFDPEAPLGRDSFGNKIVE